ncbi:MAG: heparin lyase I family protein [Ignavibacteria bacterium]|nr:heparin lyase I family protein [Ignavibacteria bacterium]
MKSKLTAPNIVLMSALSLAFSLLISCTSSIVDPQDCPAEKDILTTITDSDGNVYTVGTDGFVYKNVGNGCERVLKYFEPGFEAANYERRGDSVFYKTPQGLFPARNSFIESWDRYATFGEVFIQEIRHVDRYWNTMTLQSPLAPSVSDYVALRTCIFNGTCTFRDNRIDLATDPTNTANKVMKFTAVAPSMGMVTSKSSMESTTAYFKKGSELWYEARYYFTSQLPFSIADFESGWIDQSPGPRIVISGGALAVENKFGNKLMFRQATPIAIPIGKWVKVKVHFVFHEENGRIELWQDGVRVLDVDAPTLPLSIAIQNNIEVGITATSQACEVLVDDVRLSPLPL